MIRRTTNYALGCDNCLRIMNLTCLTPERVKEAGANRGWGNLGGQDLCPVCQVSSLQDAPLEGHHRCEGRVALAETPLPLYPLFRSLAVRLQPPSPDHLATDQAVEYCDREPVAKERRAWSVSTIGRRWQRAVATGRAVFGSWIGM